MAGQALVLTPEADTSGDGDGDGDGYGDGYGDGSGDGYGDGYGDGSGDGYGYGDGSGYGDGEAALAAYLAHPLVVAQARAGETVTLAWWRSGPDGQSANGGHPMARPAAPGVIHEVHGPLRLCGPRALHASLRPSAWSGDRWWVVGLLGDITRDGDKAGALRRLIVEEVA
jgi:hypothetical protein